LLLRLNLSLKSDINKQLLQFRKKLQSIGISSRTEGDVLICTYNNKSSNISFSDNSFTVYHLIKQPQKLVALIQSKLGMNERVFARNCHLKKIDKQTAENFFNLYHLMNSTGSAYNYGLYYKDELIAAASFSKGRKMNRLPQHQRSFELIRFCSVPGITITGGLTKLLKHFYLEKAAGDIMTYVDKQFSSGESFIKAGFKKHSETEANYFLMNKENYKITPVKNRDEKFDEKKYALLHNKGNVKLVFSL